MLSPESLAQFLRDTPLAEHLVRAAWPDLSVESRLQIIEAYAARHDYDVRPWLIELALADAAEIVRWRVADAAGLFTLGTSDAASPLTPLIARAQADASPLVRGAARRGDHPSHTEFDAWPQAMRLSHLRTLWYPLDFAEWLLHAIDAGLPDAELGACTRELLHHPRTAGLLTLGHAFPGPGHAQDLGEALRLLWAAVRRGGPRVQQELVGVLPTRLGRHVETVEALLTLPEEPLAWLVGQSAPSAEVAELRYRIHANPDAFAPALREALAGWDGSNGDIATW